MAALGVKVSQGGTLLRPPGTCCWCWTQDRREHEEDRTGDFREAQEFVSGVPCIPARQGNSEVESSCLKGD